MAERQSGDPVKYINDNEIISVAAGDGLTSTQEGTLITLARDNFQSQFDAHLTSSAITILDGTTRVAFTPDIGAGFIDRTFGAPRDGINYVYEDFGDIQSLTFTETGRFLLSINADVEIVTGNTARVIPTVKIDGTSYRDSMITTMAGYHVVVPGSRKFCYFSKHTVMDVTAGEVLTIDFDNQSGEDIDITLRIRFKSL